MFDIDGTLVPYDYQALPSDNVASAIKKAQGLVEVCTVTGRSYAFLEPVLKKLKLTSGYAVVNNGAYVINIASKEIVHEQTINDEDAHEITDLFHKEQIPFYVKQDPFERESLDLSYPKDRKITRASMFFTQELFLSEKIDNFIDTLSHNPNLTIHKTHHNHPEKFGVIITHANATKLHGIHKISELLYVDPQEMIGVGDSYNDFPLLLACGLKVAMGNAIEDLKAIADYVAPHVNEDGVADVIEKFILNPNS